MTNAVQGVFCTVAVLGLVLPVSIAGANIALALLTAMLALAVRRREAVSWDSLRDPAVYALLIYCGAALVSSLCGLDPARSLRNLPKDLHKLWALSAVLLAFSLRPSPGLHRVLAIPFVFLSLIGFWQVAIMKTGHPGFWMTRAQGFAHPVTYGQFMAQGLLGGLCFWNRPEAGTGTPRAMGWTAAFIGLTYASLILSQTRGAFLGLMVGFAALSLVHAQFRRRLLWLVIAVAVAVAAWELMPIEGRSLRSITEHIQRPSIDGKINPYLARIALWQVAARIFLDHPAAGIGPNNFSAVFGQYYPTRIDGERIWGSAHNLYLHQLAERGLLGFAALALLLGVLTVQSYRRARTNPNAWNLWAFGAMAAFLVINLTETAFQSQQITTFVLFVWAWGKSNSQVPAGKPNDCLG